MKNKKSFLKNKSILVKEGTGSFENLFFKNILKNKKLLKKQIILRRNELKQIKMSQKCTEKKNEK